MNTNVTSGFFSSKDVDFTLRFPRIVKNMQLEREHFQWLHTWKRGFILFCTVKHLFQLHTWQFILQVRVVLELRSTVASLTTSLLPDWITSPQWGVLLFKHNYTGRLSIPNHSLGIANSFFSTTYILVPRGRDPSGLRQESIPGADQKDRGLWGRECTTQSLKRMRIRLKNQNFGLFDL